MTNHRGLEWVKRDQITTAQFISCYIHSQINF